MSNQDRLLSDEELEEKLFDLAVQNVTNNKTGKEYYALEPFALIDLINTQKRLYAESVLMPIKNIYMQADYEGTDDDMIQEIIKLTERGLTK